MKWLLLILFAALCLIGVGFGVLPVSEGFALASRMAMLSVIVTVVAVAFLKGAKE